MPRPAEIARITVVAHPPERGGRRPTPPAQAGGCCCTCCCCCLHSLGALIGAAVAPAWRTHRPPPTQEEEDYADLREPVGPGAGPSAVLIYWVTVLVLGSLVLVGPGVLAAVGRGGGNFANGVLMTGLALLLGLPALLLVAVPVAMLVLCVYRRPKKADQFGQLGRIALGVIVGTVLGILPMACLLVVFIKR